MLKERGIHLAVRLHRRYERQNRPDFDVTPADGYGHYAGNVDQTLDDDGKPVLVGSGYKVLSEWTDGSGRSIAPHLYNVVAGPCFGATPGVAIDGQVTIWNQCQFDSYDSTAGAYGGANVTAEALLSTNSTADDGLEVVNNSDFYGDVLIGPGGDPGTVVALSPNSSISGTKDTLPAEIPMPVLTEPTGLGPSVGDVRYDGGNVYTLSSDMHVDRFEIFEAAVVKISGNLTILCEGDYNILGGGRLEILPGSSLDLYIKGWMLVSTSGNGNTLDPSAFRIYQLSTNFVKVQNNAPGQLFAQIYAPQAALELWQGGEVYGTFVGSMLDMNNNAKFHVDTSLTGASAGSRIPREPPAPPAAARSAPPTRSRSGSMTYRARTSRWCSR